MSVLALMMITAGLAAQDSTLQSAPTLRELAELRGMLVGSRVSDQPLANDSLYRETLSREFNVVTTSVAMKFARLRPTREVFAWDNADRIVRFASANGITVRGHTLLWHNAVPDWLADGRWSRAEMTAIIREHISTVVGRYRGRVAVWDVVNEQFGRSGRPRRSLFQRVLGSEYIDLAFRVAREADPDALLFYNDTRIEVPGPRFDAVLAMAEGMLQRGTPIDGVGIQMHLSLDAPPSMEDVATNIRRLGDLGLEVHITELDVRIPEPVTQAKLLEQARIYRDVARVCLAAPSCTALVMWGFTDRYSSIPRRFPGYGSALILDRGYLAKPAYHALVDALTIH